jgi:hypothetical protein
MSFLVCWVAISPRPRVRPKHAYQGRPPSDKHGVNLISDPLRFGWLSYGEPNAITNAFDYAKFRSRSHDAVIRVYHEAGKMIEGERARGRFQRMVSGLFASGHARCQTAFRLAPAGSRR